MRAAFQQEPGFVYLLRGRDIYRRPIKAAGDRSPYVLVAHGTFVPDPDWSYFLDGTDVVRRSLWAPIPALASPKVDTSGVQGPARDRLTALEELARRLAGADADAVLAEVRQATADPAGYAALRRTIRHAGRPDNRPIQPHVALLEALAAREHMAELDWKAEVDEIDRALRHLRYPWRSGPPQVGPLQDDQPTETLMQKADELAQKQGARLVSLSVGSDAYLAVIIPDNLFTRLPALVHAAGFEGLEVFTPAGAVVR
jgi:hypothetical protein